jgi:UDP-N-acetyl-D-glucosamine dehydrogenase
MATRQSQINLWIPGVNEGFFVINIIGLGHVGLPLALAFSRKQRSVCGYDTSEDRVLKIMEASEPVSDLAIHEVKELISNSFFAFSEWPEGAQFDAYIICVPTPLKSDGSPDLTFIEAAALNVGKGLRIGDLVVLESTTHPGTTREILVPILESQSGLTAGRDFFVGYSPQRIDPHNVSWELTDIPKLVSGLTLECQNKVMELYNGVFKKLIGVRNPETAEMAKLFENTYRHVNIALVNELAMACHSAGLNVWDVVAAASTKPFGFQAFWPGPGVGGHCIPVDSEYMAEYLQDETGQSFRFVKLATEVNAGMAEYCASRYKSLFKTSSEYQSTRAIVAGVSYKPGVSDTRNTPAESLIRKLRLDAVEVVFWDPMVENYTVDGLSLRKLEDEDISSSDGLILLHDGPAIEALIDRITASALFDARGVLRLKKEKYTHPNWNSL